MTLEQTGRGEESRTGAHGGEDLRCAGHMPQPSEELLVVHEPPGPLAAGDQQDAGLGEVCVGEVCDGLGAVGAGDRAGLRADVLHAHLWDQPEELGGAEDVQQFEALEEHDADTTWCRGSRRHVAHPRTGRQHRVLNAGFGGG